MPPRIPRDLDDDTPAIGGGVIESVNNDRHVQGMYGTDSMVQTVGNLAKAGKNVYQFFTKDMHADPRLSEFLMLPGVGTSAVIAGGARDLVQQGMQGKETEAGDQPAASMTKLSTAEERRFRSWVVTNSIPFDPSAHSAFDMRGFYKQYQAGSPLARALVSRWQQRAQQAGENK